MRPPDPQTLAAAPFAAAARRELPLLGGTAELVWLPHRSTRPGRATPDRAPFLSDTGARIVADEALWRGGGLVLTPNRYPFAERQLIAWVDEPGREHDAVYWRTLFEWTDAHGLTVLANSMGAAATIARAHAHVTPERRSLLAGLGERPFAADWLPAIPDVRYARGVAPFALLALHGEASPRAAALHRLLFLRSTAAWNVVAVPGTTWVIPRRLEVPAPWFAAPLGSAEYWGRFCYADEAAFARATSTDLERALTTAGVDAALLR